MTALTRIYDVMLQETHPTNGGWEIRDLISGPRHRFTVEAATFADLDAQIAEVFRTTTDWAHAAVGVRVIDGARKPAGFARRYDRFVVVHRAVAA